MRHKFSSLVIIEWSCLSVEQGWGLLKIGLLISELDIFLCLQNGG